MQSTSMALKVRLLADGMEIPGLIRLGEVPLENATIDVPTFRAKRKIHTGVTEMPEVTATFETRRDTNTRKTLRDWFEKQQVKDVSIIYTDAEGVEFARELWSQVECKAFKDPEVDLGSVTYAKVDVTFLPYDIVEVPGVKLPMPVRLDGKVYTDAKLQTPTAASVANARREAQRGDPYLALAEWCAGCVESLSGPEGETGDVRRAMKAAPWKTAVALALYGRAIMSGDDGISSVVKCPECGGRRRLEKGVAEDDQDMRDRLYALPIEYHDGEDPVVVTLQEPVKIMLRRNGNEEETIVESVTIHFPTLTDCSRAWASAQGDEGRAQLYTLAEALVAADGKALSAAEKATFGRVIFERMKLPDLEAAADAVNGYGIDPEVERYCQACGNAWREDVDVLGFFASALR